MDDVTRAALDAIGDVDCGHRRHYAMCAKCAADAVRPSLTRLADEVERLRKELASTRTEKVAALLARIGDWDEIGEYVRKIEAEWDALKAATERVRAMAEAAKNGSTDKYLWTLDPVAVLAALDHPTTEGTPDE